MNDYMDEEAARLNGGWDPPPPLEEQVLTRMQVCREFVKFGGEYHWSLVRGVVLSENPDDLKLDDYRNAPGGAGPLAAQWKDKPHRLVYDLCREISRLRGHLLIAEVRIEDLLGPTDPLPIDRDETDQDEG